MNFKYVRIQGRELSYITKYPKGIFAMCWRKIYDGVMEETDAELFKETMPGLKKTCRYRMCVKAERSRSLPILR